MAKSKTPDRLKVTVNGQKQELLMTYSLLNEVCNLLGSNGQIATSALDGQSRMALVVMCLAKRGKAGCLEGDFSIDDLDIAPDTVVDLCEWASGHALDFFLKATAMTGRLAEKYGGEVQNLQQRSIGSAVSASMRDAVGSSTPSQAA